MPPTPIHLETGTHHLLAWCSECPSWRRLYGSRGPALRAAAQHLDLTHGDAQGASELRYRAGRLVENKRDTP